MTFSSEASVAGYRSTKQLIWCKLNIQPWDQTQNVKLQDMSVYGTLQGTDSR